MRRDKVMKSVTGKLNSTIGPEEAGFVLEEYPLYNLVRTTSTYTEEMAKELKRYKLDTMKWRILMLLNDRSPSSVGELARRSVTKLPTLTRVLIRMENEGLIVRAAEENDRRIVQVTMTPKAVKTLKSVQAIGQKMFERVFDGFSDKELQSLTANLKKMRSNLNRSHYEPAAATRAKAS